MRTREKEKDDFDDDEDEEDDEETERKSPQPVARPQQQLTRDEVLDLIEGHLARALSLIQLSRQIK